MNVLNKNLCVVLLCVFTATNTYASDSEVFSGFSSPKTVMCAHREN